MRTLGARAVGMLSALLACAAPSVLAWDPDVEALMAELGRNPEALNPEAVRKLSEVGPRALGALCESARSPVFSLREGSAQALKRMVEIGQAQEHQIACLKSAGPAPYASSLNTTQVKSLLPPVVEQIKASAGPLPAIREPLGQAGAAAAPYLIPLLQHPNRWARWNAIDGLQSLARAGRLTPATVKLVAAILDELSTESQDPAVQSKAAQGLPAERH